MQSAVSFRQASVGGSRACFRTVPPRKPICEGSIFIHSSALARRGLDCNSLKSATVLYSDLFRKEREHKKTRLYDLFYGLLLLPKGIVYGRYDLKALFLMAN